MTSLEESALVEKGDCDIEEVAHKIATAKTKEDLLLLLANVSHSFDDRIIHDESLMDSAAEGLAKSLHNAILLRDGSQRKYYRSSLSYNGALQCTVLITATEMLLRCSPGTLDDHIHMLEKELVPSLPRILQLFVTWEGGDAIRLFTISNAIRIIRRVGPHCQDHTEDFVLGLLCALRGHVSAVDVHVEAASAIAHLLNQQSRCIRRRKIIEMIQNDSSLIISVLSTAALAATGNAVDEVLTGLFNFAVNSHAIRVKMAKRRCTILAIAKHLASQSTDNRRLALNICKCLLNDPLQRDNDPVRLDHNSELLIDKVMECAFNEPDSTLQTYAIVLLGDAVANANLPAPLVEYVMTALKEIATGDGQDDSAIEASITYLQTLTAMSPSNLSEEILSSAADFTTLPYARSRAIAIRTLEIMTADDAIADFLLWGTEMLENLSLIIVYGSDDDCVDAMNVARLLADNRRHHEALCQNSGFLRALVQLVTKEDVVNHDAYVCGIETILALLAYQDNVRHFLPFIDLLPSLVSLANTATNDDELKQRLDCAIVRLSSAILG